jgi:metallo-beta-lactamase family protein
MKITFWGATHEVTGSKTFIELPEGLVMIDCGLVQGDEKTEEKNLKPLPFNPKEVKAVIVTHAHLDHSGYLPRLIKKGFNGPIYCTPASSKLIRIILLDSAGLMEDEFYTTQDVQKTLSLIKTIEWNESTSICGANFKFVSAGHILGASSVIIESQGKKIMFSGDLGRTNDPIIPPPEKCPTVDMVVMESTYGNRNRTGDMEKELHTFLVDISKNSRVGIIASFAVARAQMLLTLIYEFHERHPEYKFRVVMDSPMMKEASKVYKQYAHLTLKKDSLFSAISEGEVIEHIKEWKSLQKKDGPLLIITSSGMLSGGRIKRHLQNWQDDSDAILFLPGYQAEGTPGRAFIEGQRQIKMDDGNDINWHGQVLSSDAFSSHADQSELMDWIDNVPQKVPIYLVHGDDTAKEVFKRTLLATGRESVIIPLDGDTVTL